MKLERSKIVRKEVVTDSMAVKQLLREKDAEILALKTRCDICEDEASKVSNPANSEVRCGNVPHLSLFTAHMLHLCTM